MTVHNFIVNKRIISACQIMSEGKSITGSWQQTGFADSSSFFVEIPEKLWHIPQRIPAE